MEDLLLTIPTEDKAFIKTLAARMDWKMRERRNSIERFISSCTEASMTDAEISEEVNAVRYQR